MFKSKPWHKDPAIFTNQDDSWNVTGGFGTLLTWVMTKKMLYQLGCADKVGPVSSYKRGEITPVSRVVTRATHL